MPEATKTQSAPEQVARLVCQCPEQSPPHVIQCRPGKHTIDCRCEGTARRFPWLWTECPCVKGPLYCQRCASSSWHASNGCDQCNNTNHVLNVTTDGLLEAAKTFGEVTLNSHGDWWQVTITGTHKDIWVHDLDTPQEALSRAILRATGE